MALNGQLKGKQLTRLPFDEGFWFSWAAFILKRGYILDKLNIDLQCNSTVQQFLQAPSNVLQESMAVIPMHATVPSQNKHIL